MVLVSGLYWTFNPDPLAPILCRRNHGRGFKYDLLFQGFGGYSPVRDFAGLPRSCVAGRSGGMDRLDLGPFGLGHLRPFISHPPVEVLPTVGSDGDVGHYLHDGSFFTFVMAMVAQGDAGYAFSFVVLALLGAVNSRFCGRGTNCLVAGLFSGSRGGLHKTGGFFTFTLDFYCQRKTETK